MREREAGEGPLADAFSVGRFAFDPGAFARAWAFIERALIRDGDPVEAIGLDEIGKLELARGEGLRPCLDGVLGAMAEGRGPRLLVCAARDGDSADALRDLARAAGLEVAESGPAGLPEAIAAARRALA
jgi:hypothetical protein